MDALQPYVGLIGAIIGALLGATVAAWYNRRLSLPKPAILVDEIAIDSSATPPKTVVKTINRDLVAACDSNPFIEVTIEDDGAIEEKKYVEYLCKVCEEIDQKLRHTLPSVKEAAKRLQHDLATKDYESLEKHWLLESRTLWHYLAIATIEGHFECENAPEEPNDATQADPRRNEPQFYHVVSPPENNTVIVSLDGPRGIRFEWTEWASHPPHVKDKAEKLAQWTANAIAQHDIACLNRIVNFMLNGRDYESELKNLREQVKQEQRKYDRLVVRGQVSNTGKSPFSVTVQGKLFVSTKGYPHVRLEHNNTNQFIYPEDMQVDVVVLAESEEQEDTPRRDTPVSVHAGSIKSFTATSVTRIVDLRDSDVLRRAFDAGERRFYLGMKSITTRSEPKPLYSAPQLFRNWRTREGIPPRRRISLLLFSAKSNLLRWLRAPFYARTGARREPSS